MYAIITTGGKQYRAELGAKFSVEKLEAEIGAEVDLQTIMAVKDGKAIQAGAVKVRAKVVEHGLGPKLDIFKYKPKKNYRRRIGHRQPFTVVEITGIA